MGEIHQRFEIKKRSWIVKKSILQPAWVGTWCYW